MSTRFFTNEAENTLLKKFEGILEHNKTIKLFDALVGFFRSSGYFAIRPHFEHIPKMRILVGINVDTVLAKYQAKGLLFRGDSDDTIADFMADMKTDVQSADYRKDIEEGILQFIEDTVSGKLEVRAHPSRRIHAKIYIFRPDPFNEHSSGHVITGSSNLTSVGIGHSDVPNYEFNALLNNYDDVKFATDEFERLWEEGISVLPADLGKIKNETFLNDSFTPFQVYMKFLMEYFGRSVEFDPSSVSDLPHGFKRLSYQVDAINQGFEILSKHGGFFLADVVGLGKTIVATQIAKKFFYTNGYPSHNSRTLIVVPPALKDTWQETLDQFGLPNFRIITNGSLHKIKNPEVYDLIVVDEAHKFRNDTAGGYTALQILCKTPTTRVLPNGLRANKKVILVSATPLNNRPEDIRNLVYLFQDGKDSTLSIANLNGFFARRIQEYRNAKRLRDLTMMQVSVAEIYDSIREHVITPLTVRRTRTDLRENEAYLKDLEEQGIRFPEVERPKRILYQLEPELEVLYDRTMNLLAGDDGGMTYNRYRAIQFLTPGKKMMYQSPDLLSSQLAKIMKTLLVKRLDSSFHAFRQSLKRFHRANDAMLKMFESERIYIAPNVDVNSYILDEREDELIALLADLRETDPTIDVCTPDDFEPGFHDGLIYDGKLLEQLIREWDEVEDDPKLEELLGRLKNELLKPGLNPGRKLVIFSESKETSHYLADALQANGYSRVLEVDAENRNSLRGAIRANFDANIPITEQEDDYDVVVSTEVLAEGVNLHRANVVLNYDTPWNATKLMQRIGRVNRIGSLADRIHNYVFYPTAKVDDDIELKKRAVMKLQAFHSALGEDSQIYSQEEETGTFGLFEKGVEEERDESLAFLMELRRFREEDPAAFRQIKNMPLRARCGRRDKTKPGSTLAFIRNRHRDAFYFINADGELEELTFVQCARQFDSKVKEKAVLLHEKHHDHVLAAQKDFEEQIRQDASVGRVVDTSQGPQEKRALAFLEACRKLPITGDAEKQLIGAAQNAIRMGKFQQLARDVNSLQKSQKKQKSSLSLVIDTLVDILGKYPIDDLDDDVRPALSVRGYADLKPEIIISESYTN